MTDVIAQIVQQACAADTNVFGYGIWTHHITRVVDHARRLAPVFGADPYVVELAALLHDYAGIKDAALHEEHHVYGPMEAERLLRGSACPPEKIAAVKSAIATHRGSVPGVRSSPEAACLAAADAVAHFEQVPSLLYFAYTRRGMGIDEGAAWVLAKLERSWAKLDPRVRPLFAEKYASACNVVHADEA